MGYLSCTRHRLSTRRANGGTADKCKDRGIEVAELILGWLWEDSMSIAYGALDFAPALVR